MDKLLFSKFVDDISVGHLYEHIFCDLLADFLRSRGKLSYVDYSLSARTYHDGRVVIELDIYTKKTAELIKEFISSEIEITKDLINGGLLQIMAELKSDVTGIESDRLEDRLDKYNKTPWENGEATPNNWILVNPAIEYEKTKENQFGVIEQFISISKSDLSESLWPLYLIVSKAIRSNLVEDITSASFCFTYENDFINRNELIDINRYRVDKRQSHEITHEYEIASNFIKMANESSFSERLSDSLINAKPGSVDYPAPEEIQVKLGISIADDFWIKAATSENIQYIINSLRIDFSFKG